jgi:hypothetical protein
MNCPYCNKHVPGMTGLQEADNFRKHLMHCRKSPAAQLAKHLHESSPGAGGKVQWRIEPYDLKDALEIRASSGQ